MRIALVSQEYPPETAHGGIATQTRAKALGLAALGHEVHVISHSTTGARVERADGGVHVIRIPGFDAALPLRTDIARDVTYSACVAAELHALHARVALDLVDFPEWASEGYVHLVNRERGAGPRVVVHLHGPLVMLAHTIQWPDPASSHYRIGVHLEGTCLKLADAVMSSSRCSRAWAAERYGIDPDRVPVLHTGVDTTHFAPGAAPKDERPTILFVGRVARSKGVETLVRAACDVAGRVPRLALRIVGRAEPAFARELEGLARDRGHADLLDFAGFVSRDGLPRELARATLFAAPSRYEGGPGFVYLEAMACGLPVIACSGSGAADVVAESAAGMLVAPDHAGELAGALEALLADAGLRDRLSANARAYATTHADSRACIAKIEGFYRGVIAGRS